MGNKNPNPALEKSEKDLLTYSGIFMIHAGKNRPFIELSPPADREELLPSRIILSSGDRVMSVGEHGVEVEGQLVHDFKTSTTWIDADEIRA